MTNRMEAKPSTGISISVRPEYDAKNSFPAGNRFFFKYYITISNFSANAVKLLKRKWLIYDVGFGFTEVAGDGVIGLTPEIAAGESFTYFSNVLLRSGIGYMSGSYKFEDLRSGEKFPVEIPQFSLLSAVMAN